MKDPAMTSLTGTPADADRALKARHRSMWALGYYPSLAADLLPSLGTALVEACAVGPDDRLLDVAAGAGNVAIAAAATGARVVASDLTPELFAVGMEQAAARGVELEWREADAEALPFADGSFDLVTLNNMIPFFDELTRITAPGGALAIAYGLGAATPIWVPLDRVQRELARRGFDAFERFDVPPGLALLARKVA
jgi:SAM-dependent methyltransferase